MGTDTNAATTTDGPTADDSADGDLRYGIIGSGMMGIEHMLNIAAIDGARVTAIADPEDESRRLAKLFSGLDGEEGRRHRVCGSAQREPLRSRDRRALHHDPSGVAVPHRARPCIIRAR